MNNLDPVAVALILTIITPFALALWQDWEAHTNLRKKREAEAMRELEIDALWEDIDRGMVDEGIYGP